MATKTELLDIKADVSVVKIKVQELRNDMKALREAVQEMAVSIDGLVKVIQDLREEYAAIKTQLNRHERWIKELARSVGIRLHS